MIDNKENIKIEDIDEYIPIDLEYKKKKEEARKKWDKLRKSGKKIQSIIITKNGDIKKANNLTISEQTDEIIKCASDPIYFIETYLPIFDQTKGNGGEIVPFKLFPMQKMVINKYVTNRFNITNKYRQAGISTLTCAYIAWYIMFKENRSVAIVANKLETARDEFMNDVVNFIEGCPSWLKPKPDIKDTQKLKRYDNGCELAAFSSKGLRGYTPTLLFWDEVAWTENGDKFWTSAGPTLQTGGRAVFVSCVEKNSYIYTNDGIKQIKNYIINENKLGGDFINDINILGTKKTRKTNIIYKNGYVDTLKLKTSYNKLESSLNHKYWAYKNNKYNWYKISDLNVGNYVSLQVGMNIWGNNDDCSDFKPSESKYIKNKFKPTKITKDISYLLGLFLSEGSVYIPKYKNKRRGGSFTITCGDNISYIFKNLNLPYGHYDKFHYNVSSLQLIEFLEYLGFDLSKKAPQKIIPVRLLSMDKNNIISLLQGIMDGDGYATINKNNNRLRVGIGLSSKEFITQLRVIFMNLGILTEYKKYITPKTKKVKVKSTQYRLIINDAIKYYNIISFRLERKRNIIKKYKHTKKHIGVYDNIPNGSEIIKEIYNHIKYYGIHKDLLKENIKIKSIVQRKNINRPVSRKTILKLIKLYKNKLPNSFFIKYENILNENIVWTKIKSIENSKNYTYDFSMSNENEKENDEHHMSIIYNGFITHQTPNGLDSVFYKTFNSAKEGKSNFNAIELYWFNDPRYNKDLMWIKNKNKENEVKIKDKNFSEEERLKLYEDGWEAWNNWLDEQIRSANYNMKKIAQEIMGSFLGSGDNFIAEEYLKNIEENIIRPPIRQEFHDKNLWIWEDPLPDEIYIMPIDVSAGHGEDNSTINILKSKTFYEEKIIKDDDKEKKKKIRINKLEQVAEYYGKLTPQQLGDLAYIVGSKYNNAIAIIDVTGGYGVHTVDRLFEIGYENIFYSEIQHKPTRDRLSGYIKKGQKIMPDKSIVAVDLIPGFFIGNNRASVLLEFQRSIHLDELIIKSVRTLNELKTFVNVPGNRVADHKRSFHDDSIMGIAIGIYVINFEKVKYSESKEKTKKMLDAMININDSEFRKKMEKNSKKNKKFTTPIKSNNPDLNMYIQYSWLFKK